MDENKRKWLILLNVSIGIFMSTLDGSIVNLSLPAISQKFTVDITIVQWVVTSYLLTISSFLPIFGRLSDIYGKKNIYSAGYIVFAIGSLLCGLSRSIGFLIISRIIQALGAAILMSLGQGIVTNVFPPKERGRALGITGSVVAIGSLFGPGLGGILIDSFGWASIFYINVPIGIIGYIMCRTIMFDDTSFSMESFDIRGALLFISGVSLLFFSLSSFQDKLYPEMVLYILLFISIVILGLFIRTELREVNPLIDLKLFNSYVFSLGVTSAFIMFMSMFSTTILMPFYLQNVLNYSPLKSGIVLMIFPVTVALISPFSGWLSDRIGFGILTTVGLLFYSAGLLLLSTITVNMGIVGIGFRYIFLGIGSALFQSPNNSAVMGSVPKNKLGIAGGINALVRNLGMISGVTFSVSLLSLKLASMGAVSGTPEYGPQYVASMDFVYVIAAALCFIAVIISSVRGVKSRKE